jgi:hypothetical protein
LPLKGCGEVGSRDVHPHAARELDVLPGSGEVQVRGDDAARLDEQPGEEMLRPSALVRRDHVRVAVHVVHGLLQPEVASRPGVGLVAELHCGTLLLRERRGAAVREQVDEDLVGAQQERVVAGALECPAALRLGEQGDRLDHLDLPRRRRHVHMLVVTREHVIGELPLGTAAHYRCGGTRGPRR